MPGNEHFRSRTWVEYGNFSLPDQKLEEEYKRNKGIHAFFWVFPILAFFSYVAWYFKGNNDLPLYLYPYYGARWFWFVIRSRGPMDSWSLKLLSWFAFWFVGSAAVYAWLFVRNSHERALIERVQGSSRFANRAELVNAGLLTPYERLPFDEKWAYISKKFQKAAECLHDKHASWFKRLGGYVYEISTVRMKQRCKKFKEAWEVLHNKKIGFAKRVKKSFKEIFKALGKQQAVPVPPDNGVIVGGWKNPKNNELEYLVHRGPEHVLAVAPTGAGKGINLVIPTLLTWRESCFVTDIKGENFLLTAGYRKDVLHQHIYKWEPTDKTHKFARFNPLQEITLTEDVIARNEIRTDGTPESSETAEIQQIAFSLADPDGRGLNEGEQAHWKMAAFNLLVGVITHVLYKARREKKIASIGDVRKTLQQGNCKQVAEKMLAYKHIRNPKYFQEDVISRDAHEDSWICHPVVRSAAEELASKDEREGASVVSTALAGLGLWDDDNVQWNTAKSSFTISDLVNQKEPATLYLVIPPVDLIRLVPLIRLFMSLLCSRLTQTMKIDEEKLKILSPNKHRLLIMADEFAAYKKLEQIEKGMAYFRGYGILLYIIIQSYNQMFQNYGKDEMISGNCHIHVAFAPNDLETAKTLSARCGKTTAIIGSSNISGKRLSVFHTQDSISYRETSVDLLSPNDVMSLPKAKLDADRMVVEAGDMLAFAAGCPPIYGKQMPYFMDSVMSNRIQKPPDGACDVHEVDMSHWEDGPEQTEYNKLCKNEAQQSNPEQGDGENSNDENDKFEPNKNQPQRPMTEEDRRQMAKKRLEEKEKNEHGALLGAEQEEHERWQREREKRERDGAFNDETMDRASAAFWRGIFSLYQSINN